MINQEKDSTTRFTVQDSWVTPDPLGPEMEVDLRHEPVRLQYRSPGKLQGNSWYAFSADLEATSEPHEVEILWPELRSSSGEYADNHSFADVLDRVMFLSERNGHWQRLEQTTRIPDGVRVVIPPGPSDRRLAVGMPVDMDDLNALLAHADDSEHARVERIGTAALGTPIHAVVVGDAARAEGTLVISAGQHYSEWAGLRMVDEMIRFLLGEQGELLRKRFRWIFYPWINTDALALGCHGDPLYTQDLNLNRDWGPFERPETRAVRDHLTREMTRGPKLVHLLDLHMGWHSRDTCGAGMTVPEEGNAPQALIDVQMAFANYVMERADYTDFVWRHGALDRPNFASWIGRCFGAPAQTVEISRHRWRMRADGRWVSPSPELERALGRALLLGLAAFYEG
ncbi:MAG: hypothetical protein JJU29_13385 [Verrucomicrobia bacterium]|nr:hypothetical protein [Verrucomicrobiota bacterium]MCH8512713.1 hypothetical protein [Kiritimatiellia bacterium]